MKETRKGGETRGGRRRTHLERDVAPTAGRERRRRETLEGTARRGEEGGGAALLLKMEGGRRAAGAEQTTSPSNSRFPAALLKRGRVEEKGSSFEGIAKWSLAVSTG
jgi:hypothetical protein